MGTKDGSSSSPLVKAFAQSLATLIRQGTTIVHLQVAPLASRQVASLVSLMWVNQSLHWSLPSTAGLLPLESRLISQLSSFTRVASSLALVVHSLTIRSWRLAMVPII